MDYIYSELDPSAIDFSNCLIFHNYNELPEPDESNYKRIAFISSDYSSETKADIMLICLKIDDKYTWVNALDSGVDTEVIKVLSEKVDELDENKADNSYVNSEIERVILLIQSVKEELIERMDNLVAPFIVNISKEDSSESEYGYILTLDKTWNEINNAYEAGKNVLGKYWPDWTEDALYYPSRALYVITGVGMTAPDEYVVYTSDGTFKASDPDDYPEISKTADEGELVPVTLSFNKSVDEINGEYYYYISEGEAFSITAEADYGASYNIEWQSKAIRGSASDLRYDQYGNTLTVYLRPDIDNENVQIAVCGRLKDVPSLWSEPVNIIYPQQN